MAKVVQAVNAVVEYVTGIKQGDYGDYQSVLFKAQDGEKIWKSFKPNSPELDVLRKGVKVQLVPSGEKNGKVSHNVVLMDAQTLQPSLPAPATSTDWDEQQKRNIANYISQHANLFKFCFEQAGTVADGLTEDSQRAIATTLFIQSAKHFNL